MARQLLSIIIPTYNEAENVQPVYHAVTKTVQKLPYGYEVIFVDDGSHDQTNSEINKLVHKDKHVKIIELARNFGKEIALTAGVDAAMGRAAVMLDADLQHPPDLIPEFVKKWESGADIVIGVRTVYRTSLIKRLFSSSYYRLVNRIFDTELIPHATDFRLMDRRVLDYFTEFTEHDRMTRGLIDWLGFHRDIIHFKAPRRHFGKASYSFRKLVNLGMNSFVSHSLFPLRLAGYVGVVIITLSLPLGIFIGIDRYFLHDQFDFSRPAILAVINLFLSGVTLFCLGLISLYIASIHKEVTNRPLYVVRKAKRIGRDLTESEGKNA